MKRNVFVCLIFWIVCILAVDVYAQGYVFGPAVRVNDDPPGIHNHATPHSGQRGVAVRGDTVYCLWRDSRAGDDIWFAKSIDDGQTFLPNVQVSDDLNEAILPTLAVGDDGTIYASWQDRRPIYTRYQVYFSKSTDGGLTFTPDVVVNDTAGGIKNYPHSEPTMAVDSAGNIYIAFEDYRNDRYDIYFSRSTDGGMTFLPDVMVNDSLPGDTIWRTEPGLAVDNAGNVYVVWDDRRNNSPVDIYFSKSTDGGDTFLPDVAVSDTDSCLYRLFPSVNVDERGYIHVMWYKFSGNANVFYSRSTDGGITFSSPIMVNDSIHETRPQRKPSFCVNDSGIVYAVWEDGFLGEADIYFTLSTDIGDSVFVEPNFEVDDTDSGCWNASIAVGDSGKVYVLWVDQRYDVFDIFLSVGRYESGIEEGDEKKDKETGYQFSISRNPFATVTSVRVVGVNKDTKSNLNIYDASGRLVKSIKLTTSTYQLGADLVPGVYFLKFTIGEHKETQKLIKIK